MTRPPSYLADLTGHPDLEALIDALTGQAVDGAEDFLLGPGQLPHLAELAGATGGDRRLWLRPAPGGELPEGDFAGLLLDIEAAARALDAQPDRLRERSIVLDPGPSPGGGPAGPPPSAGLLERLRAAGIQDLALRVAADGDEALLARARDLRTRCDLPLHLHPERLPEGLEATSLALGFLLEQGGIAWLTLPPRDGRPGSHLARSLLNALELRRHGINYVSCPTCGRCRVDLEAISARVQERTADVTAPLTVAIMGCEVNGPGEARHADVGIAAGTSSGLLMKGGEVVGKYQEDELVDILVNEIRTLEAAEGKQKV